MKKRLSYIADLQSGIFLKPGLEGDTLYLQGRHFNKDGFFDAATLPELKLTQISSRQLLHNGDVLFAAKGQHNYAVVYNTAMGDAVASSIFIVIRLRDKSSILPHYLAWFLSQRTVLNVLLKDVKRSTIPSINMQQLHMLEINIPALKKQELVINLDQLLKKERKLTSQINTLKSNFVHQRLLKATTY